MGLEMPGVARIDHPHEARAYARRWDRMARELDTENAPDEAKDKVRELRARAAEARRWAQQEEDARMRAQQAHDQEAEHADEPDNVIPLHPETERAGKKPRRSSRAARAVGRRVYHAARPRATRLAVSGRQHFFQGLSAPFGPAASGSELFMEALGATLAIVLIADLLRSPGAIAETSTHGLSFLQRAAGLVDPITGAKVAAPAARPAAGAKGAATTSPAIHPGAN